MIEVGARYVYQHALNVKSEWNGRSVTVTGKKDYEILGEGFPTLWYVVRDEDGLPGVVFEDELTSIEE